MSERENTRRLREKTDFKIVLSILPVSLETCLLKAVLVYVSIGKVKKLS